MMEKFFDIHDVIKQTADTVLANKKVGVTKRIKVSIAFNNKNLYLKM